MRIKPLLLVSFLFFVAGINAQKKDTRTVAVVSQAGKVWSSEKANAWYQQHQWICGAASTAREGDGRAVTGCPAARHS